MCIIILWWERGGGGVRISQVFGMFSVFNIFRKVLYTSIHSLSIQRVISKDKARRCFVKLQVLCLILVKFNLIVYLRFKDIRDRNIKWASNTKIDVLITDIGNYIDNCLKLNMKRRILFTCFGGICFTA